MLPSRAEGSVGTPEADDSPVAPGTGGVDTGGTPLAPETGGKATGKEVVGAIGRPGPNDGPLGPGTAERFKADAVAVAARDAK